MPSDKAMVAAEGFAIRAGGHTQTPREIENIAAAIDRTVATLVQAADNAEEELCSHAVDQDGVRRPLVTAALDNLRAALAGWREEKDG